MLELLRRGVIKNKVWLSGAMGLLIEGWYMACILIPGNTINTNILKISRNAFLQMKKKVVNVISNTVEKETFLLR